MVQANVRVSAERQLLKDEGPFVKRSFGGTVPMGRAVVDDGTLRVAPGNRAQWLHAVALEDGKAGESRCVQTHGWLNVQTASLGPGVACAVGVDAGGKLVRATDPACVSAPSWIGWCTTLGEVFIEPRLVEHFNPVDFGADPTGLTDSTDAFEAMIAAIGRITLWTPHIGFVTSGHEINIPAGAFLLTRTLISPEATRWKGVSQFQTQLRFVLSDPTWGTHPYGAGIVLSDQDVNYGTAPGISNLAIYGFGDGTISERARRHAGAAILIRGGGRICVEDVTLCGFKTAILNSACNNMFTRNVNFVGALGMGYPTPGEWDGAKDWMSGTNSTDIWLAANGYRAVLLGTDSGKNFASVVAGDTLVVSFDKQYIDQDNAAVTVTFQAGDTTAAACMARINAAVGRACCSVQAGDYLQLEGVAASRERGVVFIQGGSAVNKLGFRVGRAIGSGAGVGFEIYAASGFTNIFRDIQAQHNGNWVCVHEEDGANHEFRGSNFNSPGILGLIEGAYGSVWDSCESEANQSDAYFVVSGAGGSAALGWHLRHGVFTGRRPETPGSLMKFVMRPGINGYEGMPYLSGGSIRDNLWLGSTGDGRAIIEMLHPANLVGFALRGNVGYSGTFINADPVYGCLYDELTVRQNGVHGVNTAAPLAHLDVRAAGSYPPEWGLRYGQDATDVKFGVLQDGSYNEWGQGRIEAPVGQKKQQGERNWVRGRGLVWATNQASFDLDIDVCDQEHFVLDAEVTMRETNGYVDAYRAFIRRIGIGDLGLVTLDSDTSEDKERKIGTGVTWAAPTLSTGAGKVTVHVNFPTAPANKGGYWQLRVRKLQRTYY